MSTTVHNTGTNGAPIIEARSISKFFVDPVKVQVLKEVSFAVERGEFVSVMGKSGCGKSTLLYVLSTMDTDYTGELRLDGERITGLSGERLAELRSAKIGFVFQFHYLLQEFSVLRNVMLPGLKLGRHTAQEVEAHAREKLRVLGIEHLADKRADRVSGGEKQRVAIARALINDPLILMCDEPTGNLDSRNTQVVFDIFRQLAAAGQSLLVVTHDDDFAKRTDRIIVMDDGRIVDHGHA